MSGKHRSPKGKHRGPQSLSITLRATGGLVAGAAVIGLAAGTTQVAAAVTKDPSEGAATLAADAPNMIGGLPDTTSKGWDGENSSAETTGSESAAIPKPRAKPETKPEARAAVPDQAPAQAPEKAPARPDKKRPTAEDAIALAKKQVGISEDGSGETKFQDWYVKTRRAKETVERDGGGSPEIYSDAAWCSMFISWVGDQIGLSDQLGMDAWTVEHAKWFQRRDRWGEKPKPGAIVFFSWSGGKEVTDIQHVGMVIKDEGDQTLETVEGNTSNAVRIRERSTDSVVGYGYPEYGKEK